MKEIQPEQIRENLIEMIAKEKMLIAAGDETGYNMMTASWGFLGEMWGAPAAAIVVRPQRYTREFLEKNDRFSLTFLGDQPEIYRICGTISGRDADKTEMTELTPLFIEGTVLFSEARVSIVCRKQYVGRMKEECFSDQEPLRWYPENDYHDMIIGKIEKVLISD